MVGLGIVSALPTELGVAAEIGIVAVFTALGTVLLGAWVLVFLGLSFEVLSRGGESYIKDEEGTWIPTAHHDNESPGGTQSAFSFREELQDVALANMPLYPGRTEIIDGEPCQAIQMKMSGSTPDETGSASTAATSNARRPAASFGAVATRLSASPSPSSNRNMSEGEGGGGDDDIGSAPL